jgi:hypothetical protein
MKTAQIRKAFEKIGARVRTRTTGGSFRGGLRDGNDVQVDIVRDGKDEVFDIAVREGTNPDVSVIDCRPKDRHLLMMIRSASGGETSKLLCGHDERHWFAAAVPSMAANVRRAKEILKPSEAAESQGARKVRTKNRNRRKNKGFIRQGEWFFIPQPELEVPEKLILKKEPVRRGRGKPHIVEELYREGGQTVYVDARHPEGLTEQERKELFKKSPGSKRSNWQIMRRNPAAFGRGKVRHPDHKTIELVGWHRIVPNTESEFWTTSGPLVFLD